MADLPNVNIDEIGVFKSIAGSAEDTPILMLNLNRYVEDANFPASWIILIIRNIRANFFPNKIKSGCRTGKMNP